MSRIPRMKRSCALVCVALALCSMPAPAAEIVTPNPVVARETPRTLPDHPGNVYLLGEAVHVTMPPEVPQSAVRWQVRDIAATLIAEGEFSDETRQSGLELGPLNVGWYEVEFLDAKDQRIARTTAAVLAPLKAPVPQESPICVDGAFSWFAPNDPKGQRQSASLAALAGVNWVRDRLRWRELEPERDHFVQDTQYDEAARIENREGLKVLQVWHDTPPWALSDSADHGRFPADLRDVYTFSKAVAARFKGTVQAWEPWNEANAPNFGGQTIDEMCAYQKAAYLGFKASNPNVIVGWQPIGGANSTSMADGILANETWPYYDTYNIHSYDWPESYDKLWEPARRAAAGRPIWVTECDRGMKADPNSSWGDYSPENAVRKAQFIGQSYATSLFCGSSRHFHFILGYYMEGKGTVQFGLLRRDFTPRPSYVALAAVGRLLAGARCLGRMTMEGQPDSHVYVFRAQPEGRVRDVVVAWYAPPGDWDRRGTAEIDWTIPEGLRVERVYDYLGRDLGNLVPPRLGAGPLYVVLPEGEADNLQLDPPRESEYRSGEPSSVVLQLEMLERRIVNKTEGWTPQLERALSPDTPTECRLVAYNFGSMSVQGVVAADPLPEGWTMGQRTWNLSLEPLERRAIDTSITMPRIESDAQTPWIVVRGTFSGSAPTTLAFRFFPD